MAKATTHPVSDDRATRLFYGDLGEWADQVWSNLEELGQFPLTQTSTQRFDDLLAVQVPLADRLDLNLSFQFSSFGLLPLSCLALEKMSSKKKKLNIFPPDLDYFY